MSQSPLSSQLDAERAAILERAAASVLAIESPRVRQSAFVWRGGLLVTAAEPLEGAESLRALKDGTASEAEVLACDLRTDIAVVRCAAAVAPALAPAATPPRVGQTIAAVGRVAAGLTASWGSVHVSAGPWTTRRGATLARRLLLDVRLAHSAEGAAVLDLDGCVVAMAVRGPARQVLGIPIEAIEAAVSDVVAHGHIAHGYLGVRVVPLALGVQARHRLNAGEAVLIVADVAQSSPAIDAGLEIGDLLLAIDGDVVQSPDRLLGRIQGKRPGETLLLRRRRGSVVDELTITLGARPAA
ncbi:MAG TPA: S1C family serine protease [Steroidobacteraceae bacterium]|jgi:S1-C subfamily serine protease|nr:S1C family serine protease [Steroidobacteraceae bacterium]